MRSRFVRWQKYFLDKNRAAPTILSYSWKESWKRRVGHVPCCMAIGMCRLTSTARRPSSIPVRERAMECTLSRSRLAQVVLAAIAGFRRPTSSKRWRCRINRWRLQFHRRGSPLCRLRPPPHTRMHRLAALRNRFLPRRGFHSTRCPARHPAPCLLLQRRNNQPHQPPRLKKPPRSRSRRLPTNHRPTRHRVSRHNRRFLGCLPLRPTTARSNRDRSFRTGASVAPLPALSPSVTGLIESCELVPGNGSVQTSGLHNGGTSSS